MKLRNPEKAVGVACQIAFEYDNVGWEHVSDMYATYRECGERPPCSADDLGDLTFEAVRLRQDGKSYEEAEKELLEKYSKKKK